MTAQQKQLVDRMLSVWNGADPVSLNEVLADNCMYHHYRFPEPLKGRKAVQEYIAEIRSAFPDFKVIVEEMFAEDTKVVLKWKWSGTHKGKLGDIKPTGKRVSQHGVDIIHLDKNRVVEDYCIADALMLLKQLDAIPASVHL